MINRRSYLEFHLGCRILWSQELSLKKAFWNALIAPAHTQVCSVRSQNLRSHQCIHIHVLYLNLLDALCRWIGRQETASGKHTHTHIGDKVTIWTKLRVWAKFSGAVVKYLNTSLTTQDTRMSMCAHTHTSSCVSQVKYDINNATKARGHTRWAGRWRWWILMAAAGTAVEKPSKRKL